MKKIALLFNILLSFTTLWSQDEKNIVTDIFIVKYSVYFEGFPLTTDGCLPLYRFYIWNKNLFGFN